MDDTSSWIAGYRGVKKLDSGEWAGVANMMYTGGLFVGLDDTGYRTRFCYSSITEALDALQAWDGKGDPPGRWIKEKPSDRLGPGATE